MVEQETIKVSQLDENSNIQLSAKFLMTQDSKSYAVKYSSLQHKLSSQFDIVGINQRVQNNTTSINTLNTTVTQHTTSIENLIAASTAHDENIQTISENVNSISTHIGTAEANINEMSDNIDKLSEDISQINDTIDNDLNVVASSSKLGMVKCGFAETPGQKDYAVKVDTAGNMHVHVPWEGGGSGESDPRIDTLAIMSSYYVSSDNIAIPRMNYNSIKLLSGYVNQAIEETESLNDLVDKISMFDDANNLSSGLLYDLSSEVSATKFMLGSGNAKSDSSNNWITLTADSLVIAVVKNSQNTNSKIEYKENSDATPITVAGCTSSDVETVSNFTIHAKANVMFRLTGATTNLITIS